MTEDQLEQEALGWLVDVGYGRVGTGEIAASNNWMTARRVVPRSRNRRMTLLS